MIRWLDVRKHAGRNPVGVGELAAAFPRVAEYSDPGLEDESPSGKCPSHAANQALTTRRLSERGLVLKDIVDVPLQVLRFGRKTIGILIIRSRKDHNPLAANSLRDCFAREETAT